MDALRRAGYDIEARTGLGYRLTAVPDLLTEPEIRSLLGSVDRVGKTLVCLDEVDSTNNYAKSLAVSGAADGTVVVADGQTAGRGRMDRAFLSPKGKGIYLTALAAARSAAGAADVRHGHGGRGGVQAVEEVCGVRPGLKWPNDPILNGKKLSGILTELSLEAESGRLQYLVVGIGVNVSHAPEDFSPQVRPIATSLVQALGRPVSRCALAAAEIRALDRLYRALETGDTAAYLADYRRCCVNLGKRVQLISPQGRTQALALDVDDQFGLVVRLDNGEERVVRSGEVSVRGMDGYVE